MKTRMFVGGTVIAAALLAAFIFVACDLEGGDDDMGKYTNVVYSDDGSLVTIYLDGKGVPLSEAGRVANNRALNLDIAKMSYDTLEVVFVNGNYSTTGSVARANWRIGQSAGISGVPRNGTTGIDYGPVNYTAASATAASGAAVLFVGMSDGTLLGIGRIGWVDNPRGSTAVNDTGVDLFINQDTTSVTFYVTALYTSLDPSETGTGTQGASRYSTGSELNSFVTNAQDTSATAANANTNADAIRNIDGIRNLSYPIYYLDPGETTSAIYTITGDGVNGAGVMPTLFSAAIVDEGGGQVIKRVARYQYGGTYYIVRQDGVFDVEVTLGSNTAAGAAFSQDILLTFTTTSTSAGIFAFTFEVPVYAITRTTSTNADNTNEGTGLDWTIRAHYGTNQYVLDDGWYSGGLVLMGVGNTATEVLNLFYKWRERAPVVVGP